MRNVLNREQLKKFVPYIVIFCIGVYAGISLIRLRPLLFSLNEIPQDQMEIILLTEKVGKLISLPADEKPVIETVTDLSILKDKPFFAKAEIDDKVLVYEKAGMSILYRPSKNIIINTVSPSYADAIFSITSPSPSPIETPTPTPVPTPVPTPEPTLAVEPTPVATTSATPVTTVTPKPITK
jgi:hypothetical protein